MQSEYQLDNLKLSVSSGGQFVLKNGRFVLKNGRFVLKNLGTNRSVFLQVAEARLLAYLWEHVDTLIPRDRLLKDVWGNYYTKKVIDVYNYHLRQHLSTIGSKHRILAKRGEGVIYRRKEMLCTGETLC